MGDQPTPKWIGLLIGSVIFMGLAGGFWLGGGQSNPWEMLAVFVCGGIGWSFFMGALYTFQLQLRQDNAYLEMDRARAQSVTPMGETIRYLAQLNSTNPQLANLIGMLARPDKIIHQVNGRHSLILYAGTEVTPDFLFDLLERSKEKRKSERSVAPQRTYSDGVRSFHPTATDRELWEQAVNELLAPAGICEDFLPGKHVNSGPRFLHPWTAELAERWFELESGSETDERMETDASNDVEAER